MVVLNISVHSSDTSSWDPEADLQRLSADSSTYFCTYPGCGKQFRLKGNLKRHQSIHRGEKDFICSVCGRAFLRKADMEMHMRGVHTGDKPYACKHPGCTKRFARQSDQLSHERTHSGYKPFKCNFVGCKKSFSRRYDLNKHEKIHEKSVTVDFDETNSSKSTITHKKRKLTSVCGVDASSTTKVDSLNAISLQDPIDWSARHRRRELTCTEDHTHILPDCFTDLEWSDLLAATAANYNAPETTPTSDLNGEVTSACSATSQQKGNGVATISGMEIQEVPPSSVPSVESTLLDTNSIQVTGCPAATVPSLDHASHTGCGHLSIQHGNHLDFVIKNHLVCLDNVKSLDVNCTTHIHALAGRTPTNPTSENEPLNHSDHTYNPYSVCSNYETKPHGPGCGHLPVRHEDHIDYVVEDNVFCQHAGLLEGADNVALLDDDFWDFYGAIGSFTTDA